MFVRATDFVFNRIHEIMKENGITDFGRVGLYGLSYKENMDKLKGKIVFDTRKCCDLPGTYRL